MQSKITVDVLGFASAQLVRPDVAQAQWLVHPVALHVWGLCPQQFSGNEPGEGLSSTGFDTDAFAAVYQLEEFDAWRVGGGVAFRW